MTASSPHSQSFSLKAFGLGILGVAAIYGAMFAYAFIGADNTYEALQERLASQTVLVERPLMQAQIPAVQIEHSGAEHSEQPAATEPETEQSLEDIVGQQAKALREAPVQGFYEESTFGKLPIAKSRMQTPFEIYKKPFLLNLSKPFIAVGVQDFGLSSSLSESVIAELPAEVSLILSPYANDAEGWMQKARQDGHELWLQIPLETKAFPLVDPGAKGLLTRVSLQYNQERLKWAMGRTAGYAGVAFYSDEALQYASSMFEGIARDILNRGLGIFEINTDENDFFLPLAQKEDRPNLKNRHMLEAMGNQDALSAMVDRDIKDFGGTVLTVIPSPKNIERLKDLLNTYRQQGVQIVPLSALADPDIERN